MNWRHLAHYVAQQGAGAAALRAASALLARSAPMRRPLEEVAPHSSWRSWQREQASYGRAQVARAWWKAQPEAARRAVVTRAQDAARGALIYWGEMEVCAVDLEGDWSWHVDPLTGHHWDRERPSHLGWVSIRDTDIKTAWEASRFDFSTIWLRSQQIDRQTHWATTWAHTLSDWIDTNPYGLGIHWANGQEVALRGLNWLWCATHFDGLPDAFFQTWTRSLTEHACAVAHHHPHTRRSVPNNHVVMEAVFLLHAARAMPWHTQAVRWASMATQSLSHALETQWFGDGGYIQHSHTYQKLATWGLVWARDALCPQRDEALWQRLHEVLGQTFLHLHAVTGLDRGELPLYGPHDGAVWPLLSHAPARDVRPLLQTLSVLTRGARLYEEGPWDEALVWIGAEASGEPSPHAHPKLRTHPDAGWSVLRKSEDTFAVLVHGPKQGMFGQDDLMHTSLVWGGHRVTLDAGSFRYTGFPTEHAWFHGPRGHCTVTVGGRGARLEAGYFSWAVVPGTTDVVPGTTAHTLRARRTGFARAPACSHTRWLRAHDDGWEIEDAIEGTRQDIEGRWLLAPYDWRVEVETSHTCTLRAHAHPWGDAYDVRLTLHLLEATSMHVTLEQGWWSPAYGARQRAPMVRVVVDPLRDERAPHARWRARFTLGARTP